MDNIAAPKKSPDSAPGAPSVPLPPSQRVLACVLCQQRKVKCDRNFPCMNCTKSKTQCVPATFNPHRRKRRFPERELLKRLRDYEDLLRQNNIKFEPLHKPLAEEKESSKRARSDLEDKHQEDGNLEQTIPSPLVKSETKYEAKDLWDALNQVTQDPDDRSDSSHDHLGETVIKNAWDQFFGNNDPLFGSRRTAVDLSAMHPSPIHIFQLWQVYSENINPLFKVTHTPTLQALIIGAASDVNNIAPPLEALMFSIYCISVLTMDADHCPSLFGCSKRDLLAKYRFGCQQALWNSGFLRTSDRDCLTALFLYLVSVRSGTDPRSLSSLLGIAIRIAQRMGLDSESACARFPALEAEMRRRLWWALVLFDTRIGEMAHLKNASLSPTWDCKMPLNINDFDLRPEMKKLPSPQAPITESLFVVVRNEVADFVRHSTFHLDFSCPALKSIAKGAQQPVVSEADRLLKFEKMLDEKYFKFCDPENPLHLMTIFITRGYLAKCRLLEHYSRSFASSINYTNIERDGALSQALQMLEIDTKLMNSPLTKRYHWLAHFNFPFTAYIHVSQDLRKRPGAEEAERAWESMSDNYEARSVSMYKGNNPFFIIFTKIITQAWEARESWLRASGKSQIPPRLLSYIIQNSSRPTRGPEEDEYQHVSFFEPGADEFPMLTPPNIHHPGLFPNMAEQQPNTEFERWIYPSLSAQNLFGIDANQIDWTGADWGL